MRVNLVSDRFRFLVVLRFGLLVIVGLALAAGPSFAADKVKAKVDGKKITFEDIEVQLTHSDEGFFVHGGKSTNGGKRFLAIGLGCPIDFENANFPLTSIHCAGTYTESKPRKGKVRSWVQGTGFEVTIDSFDGNKVKGRWSGDLAALVNARKDRSTRGRSRRAE